MHSFPKAVVFDLDGLMFNTEMIYQRVGTEVLRRRGKTFDEGLLDQMMGRTNRVALSIMIDWHNLSDTVEQLNDESADLFIELLDEHLETMPGLLELLDALEQASIPKAIATSSGPRFAHGVLGRFDLAKRFEFALTGEDVQQGKPHPEMYHLAASRLQIEPAEMLVLEDSQNGCQAAVAAGAIAVAVPEGRSLQHSFAGAALVADSLADPRIYQRLGIEPV